MVGYIADINDDQDDMNNDQQNKESTAQADRHFRRDIKLPDGKFIFAFFTKRIRD